MRLSLIVLFFLSCANAQVISLITHDSLYCEYHIIIEQIKSEKTIFDTVKIGANINISWAHTAGVTEGSNLSKYDPVTSNVVFSDTVKAKKIYSPKISDLSEYERETINYIVPTKGLASGTYQIRSRLWLTEPAKKRGKTVEWTKFSKNVIKYIYLEDL